MKKVLIYCDYGCSDVLPLKIELERSFKGQAVQVGYTDAAHIIKHNVLNKDVLMFVMPGGAANPYRQKLHVLGNRSIFDYVINGGTYFGICAGAYYACRKTQFEQGIKNLEVIEEYGLNLIEGTAIGTLYKQLRIMPYSKTASSEAVANIIMDNTAQKFIAHYHGGPYFVLNESSGQQVEARYEVSMKLPAVISRTLGDGKIILSGVHVENSGQMLKKLLHPKMSDWLRAKRVCQKLEKHEHLRRKLFDTLIEKGLNR